MQFTFLICTERCGGNLLTRLLDTHSSICGPHPTHLFRMILKNASRYAVPDTDETWKLLMQDARDLFEVKMGSWASVPPWDELTAMRPPRSVARLIRQIYEHEAFAQGKTHIFVKENHTSEMRAALDREFDRPSYILLARDPRDMALSWKKAPSMRGGVLRAANIWADDWRALQVAFPDAAQDTRLCVARYEDLLQNPETELRRICTFLQCTFEKDMLQFHARKQSTPGTHRAAEWRNLDKPLISDNFAKFKELSDDECAYVEAVCSEGMRCLNYPATFGASAADVTALTDRLRPIEPYNKATFDSLPCEERLARQRQFEVLSRLRPTPGRPAPAFDRSTHED